MKGAINIADDLLVVRVLTRENLATLRLCACMAEVNVDTLPPSMRQNVRDTIAFLRSLRVSDLVVRTEKP